MRLGTPLPSMYWRRTVWPGPLGATMMMFTFFGGTMVLKWIEKPCENNSVLPGGQIRRDVFLISRGLLGVRQRNENDVGALDGFGGGDDFKAFFLGDGNGLAAFVKADDDLAGRCP